MTTTTTEPLCSCKHSLAEHHNGLRCFAEFLPGSMEQCECEAFRAGGEASGETGAGCAKCAAVIAALQELEKWPDLPNVRFGVKLNVAGGTEDWTLRPEQVTGIYEALSRHVATLLPFGVEAVKALHEVAALRERVEKAEAERDDFSAQSEARYVAWKAAEERANTAEGDPVRVRWPQDSAVGVLDDVSWVLRRLNAVDSLTIKKLDVVRAALAARAPSTPSASTEVSQ
jgi:hypothetical protein